VQIFRDDTRRRWRRLQVLFVALSLVTAATVFLFVKTLRPRPAAFLRAPSAPAALDLAEVRVRAIAKASSPAAVVVPPGIAALSAMSSKDGKDAAPIRMAFVDATEQEAIRAVELHGDKLTHLAIEGLHVRDREGGVLGQLPDDALKAAKDKHLKIIEVVDDVRDDVPRPADVSALGRDRALARRFASILLAKLQADGADGVMLALGEDDADLDGSLRAALAEEVYAKLKPAGMTVAVRFDGRFAPEAVVKQAKLADLVIVRAFGGLDPSSSPAPLAPRAWVEGTIDAAQRLVPAKKLVVTLGVRSGAWPVNGQDLAPAGTARELQWGEVIARARSASVKPMWDGKSGNLVVVLPGPTGIASSAHVRAHPGDDGRVAMVSWMTDAATLADGLATLAARGLQHVALGNLGGEDPRVWRVLDAPRDDREAVRAALATLPAPSEPDVIGDGVAMRVDLSQHEGTATVDFGAGGRIESESYDVVPAAPTVTRRGKVPSHTVVLTFDDGPHEEYTGQILDALAEEQVKAAFFVVGSRAEREPEMLKRIVAEGHEVGNHSFSHPDLGKISDQHADLEINSTNRLLEALTGRGTVLFRPPFRSDDRPTVKEDLLAIQNGQRNGMITVTSTVDPHDWARPEPEIIVDYLVRRLEKFDGGVVLMHDGGGDRKNTVAALRPLIRTLKSRGFQFQQLHQIFAAGEQANIDVVNPRVHVAPTEQVGHAVWASGTWLLRGMTVLALAALALGLFRFAALAVGALLEVAREWRERQRIRRTSRLPLHGAVSVIIPAYNEAKVIERTILSVLASRGMDVEVLVMDDGSSDDTADVVSRAFYFEPRVKLHKLKNGGKARALNEGFKLASHEVVIALDADTIFLPDTIVELARKFDDPKVAAVAGRAAVGNTQHFVARWQALEYVIGQAIERRAWHLLGVVSVVPGAVGAWHRDAVLAVGGFGTDTLAEDCDLTITLQVHGWKVSYAPDAVALTEAPETVQALLKQRFRWCFGVLQTVWKHKRAMIMPPKNNPAIGILLMPCVLACHIITPLLAPLADLAALIAIVLGHGKAVMPYLVALVIAEVLLTTLAMKIDRARFSLMWDWLINRSVYRWFLFIALTRAVFAALRGGSVGWGKLVRTGSVEAPSAVVAAATPGPARVQS
jgi:cellulose synthase/poly-beta-1,6-N-acetylglucosamine synthase-like glycosyltransferase/peptidoglycan/xylan/chitin deacetylase (PgdA/CDA1 family)